MIPTPQIKAPQERFAEKHHPETLPSRLLDLYLERGWYRMGQAIFTTHFLSFEDSILSAIWTRLDLQGYTFRKSLRKLMRRNSQLFTHHIRPAMVDEKREWLFYKYRESFPAELAPSIEDYLFEGHASSVFDTWEVAIYQNDKLVAISYFDKGHKGAESIIGIYDPDLKAHSLGFYSMLIEMQHCQEQGIRYYYPGYVVPGNPRFDYKLRIGPVEYYDLKSHDWKPHAELTKEEIPLDKMRSSLLKMKRLASERDDIHIPLLYNPLFEATLISYLEEEAAGHFLDFPVMLFCGRAPETARFYLVVYDPRTSSYNLLCCILSLQLWFHFHQALKTGYDPEEFMQIPLVVEKIVTSGKECEEFYSRIRSVFGFLSA